jgi:hypothetical protein
MTYIFWLSAVAMVVIVIRSLPSKPKYSPVKAVCQHCYELHDGPMVLCDACEWSCFPDGLVQEEIREQVDAVQYRTSGIDGKGEQ